MTEQEEFVHAIGDRLFPAELPEDVRAMFAEWPQEMQEARCLSDMAYDTLFRAWKQRRDEPHTWTSYVYFPKWDDWFVQRDDGDETECIGPLDHDDAIPRMSLGEFLNVCLSQDIHMWFTSTSVPRGQYDMFSVETGSDTEPTT